MGSPSIAFCTTCRGRLQHLRETLPRNISDNLDYPYLKHIVLDYNSRDGLSDYLKTCHRADIESGRLVVYSFPSARHFQMAHAKNMAHRLGMIEGAGVLVNLDADNFTGPGFAGYIAGKISENSLRFLWANRNQPAESRYPKGCNGRIVVTSAAFVKTGGYDESKYNKWGPDDKDFHCRVRRLGYDACEIPRKYLNVILHTDKMRFKEYQDVEVLMSSDEFTTVAETATIANFGDFGCGVVFKNFSTDPIELTRLPTRIFGIGMHKTGTTSLHTALEILGYSSGHWKSVEWAKSIYDDLTWKKRPAALEDYYALSDLPIPLFYRELDSLYPRSKFILTLRDERAWLASVQRHWSIANEFRDTWNKQNNFPLYLHRELYGQEDFDAEVFIRRYRRHNSEVLEYFKDRKSDLLVMDMSSGAGWPELCGFLRRGVPNALYPHQFKSNPAAGEIHTRRIELQSESQVMNITSKLTVAGYQSVSPDCGVGYGKSKKGQAALALSSGLSFAVGDQWTVKLHIGFEVDGFKGDCVEPWMPVGLPVSYLLVDRQGNKTRLGVVGNLAADGTLEYTDVMPDLPPATYKHQWFVSGYGIGSYSFLVTGSPDAITVTGE
jgi:hypothetical protein